jgi:type II secretory pathway pseudopilin PulG
MKIISKAFSLIELATAIGILVIILGLGALWYQKIRQSYFLVEKNAFLIKRVLESAREFALLGKENTPWSVYIVNRTNKNDLLYIFRGTTFSTSSIWRIIPLTGDVDFQIPTTSTPLTITFSLWKGETSSTTLKLKAAGQSTSTADILIYPSGKVEVIIYE